MLSQEFYDLRDQISGMTPTDTNIVEALSALADKCGRMAHELERKYDRAIDTVAACLIAAGGSEDIDELEQQVKAAGTYPSDFVRQQFQGR